MWESSTDTVTVTLWKGSENGIYISVAIDKWWWECAEMRAGSHVFCSFPLAQVFLLQPNLSSSEGEHLSGSIVITRSARNHRLMDVKIRHALELPGQYRRPEVEGHFHIEWLEPRRDPFPPHTSTSLYKRVEDKTKLCHSCVEWCSPSDKLGLGVQKKVENWGSLQTNASNLSEFVEIKVWLHRCGFSCQGVNPCQG